MVTRLQIHDAILRELRTRTAIQPLMVEYEYEVGRPVGIEEVLLSWNDFVHLIYPHLED